MNLSITQELSVDAPNTSQPVSPEKKNKFKSSTKGKILAQQQTLSHFVSAKAAK
jgi:hypothetical protein